MLYDWRAISGEGVSLGGWIPCSVLEYDNDLGVASCGPIPCILHATSTAVNVVYARFATVYDTPPFVARSALVPDREYPNPFTFVSTTTI